MPKKREKEKEKHHPRLRSNPVDLDHSRLYIYDLVVLQVLNQHSPFFLVPPKKRKKERKRLGKRKIDIVGSSKITRDRERDRHLSLSLSLPLHLHLFLSLCVGMYLYPFVKN